MNHLQKTILFVLALIALIVAVGCGSGGTGSQKPPTVGQSLIDPTGNWKMSFTDASNNTFILSALFDQVGAVVTALNTSEVGNGVNFGCIAQPNVSFANGLVANVSTFSGDLAGNFGTIHFTSTLNDPGTHTSGTYTLTPGAAGNCLGLALTGTFTGDEVPSMSGTWTGTVTCISDCPAATPAGTPGSISATLVQHDDTGAVTGTYTVAGLLPGISSGVTAPDSNNLLSGASIQQRLSDNTGNIVVLVGGPLNTLGTAGVGLDRSFHGNIVTIQSPTQSQAVYAITMSH